MVTFLTNSSSSFDYVPYASTVVFELMYLAECVERIPAGQPANECYGVNMIFNGKPLYFQDQGCTGSGFSPDGYEYSGCTYDEFTTMITNLWYSGPHADDLDFACMQTPQPSDI